MDDAFQASKHERRMGDETQGMGNRTAVWTKANTRTPRARARARYLTETPPPPEERERESERERK